MPTQLCCRLHAPYVHVVKSRRRLTATVHRDCGYGVTSALALAVEAAEAFALTSSTVTSGLTAAVRSIERSVLKHHSEEHHMHATIRRYEGVDTTRMNDVTGKVNETLVTSFMRVVSTPS